MGIFEKLRNVFTKEKPTVKIPASWAKKPKTEAVPTGGWKEPTVSPKFVKIKPPKKPFHIRIPFLLQIKRTIAAFLLIFNFVIGQSALATNPEVRPLYVIFMLNCFISLDYLWKTRKRPQ